MVRRVVALVLAFAATAAGAEPACETRLRVTPAEAWVGQQVEYRLQILRRADVEAVRFVEPLAFPSFRAEWLPGQSVDPALRETAPGRLVAEERRALFPVRAGRLPIPAARIECRTRDGAETAAVEAASVEVRETAGGVPLVGAVGASASLEPPRVALGESALLLVTLHGVANLWDAADPLAGVALGDTAVHRREGAVEREAGRALVLERRFAYDLVPRRPGVAEIPPLRVAWIDPASGAERIAETAALRLEVATAPAETAATAETTAEPPPAPTAHPTDSGWDALALIAAFVLASAAILFFSRGAGGVTSALAAATPHLDAARAAAARGDRAAERDALAEALRAALTTREPELRALAAEELVARSAGARREAALALVELDRARFGAGGDAASRIDADRVRALVIGL